jgi:hypothetical protein
MSNCGSNNTLDPYKSILDGISLAVDTLEKQSSSIVPFVTQFRLLGSTFNPSNISLVSVVDNALNQFTADAICAGATDIAPINQLEESCLNLALSKVKKYLNNILGNIEDGIDLITDIVNLPEYLMMKLLQKLWKLCQNIEGLISSIDKKIQCVSLSDQAANYQSQIDDLMDRITTVTNDLYLTNEGQFDPDTLMTGFNSELQNNINSFKTRSDNLQTEIKANVSNTTDLTALVNPKTYF